ncbi:MAG: replication-relaxation family protein [Leucobacter sp.]
MFDHAHPIHEQLLELIREHRFITTHQLVRFTRSGYGSKRSAMRQTLRHLTALHDRSLIVRLERRVGGWQGGSTVTIWTLTTKGLRHLTGSTARLRPHHYSTTFLEHLLAITETRVVLHEATEQHTDLQIEAQGEPHCWRRYLSGHGMTVTLKPDLAVMVTSPEFVDRYLFEIDRAIENPARVIRKCWQYVQHRRSGHEQERHDGIYPFVVWLVPHAERKQQLLRALEAEPKLQRELFTVITPNELLPLIRDGPAAA